MNPSILQTPPEHAVSALLSKLRAVCAVTEPHPHPGLMSVQLRLLSNPVPLLPLPDVVSTVVSSYKHRPHSWLSLVTKQ